MFWRLTGIIRERGTAFRLRGFSGMIPNSGNLQLSCLPIVL
jgi:hypothetical protein